MSKTRPTIGMGWPTLAVQTWLLGAESSLVIGLRCARLAGGGPVANRESVHMVVEKWQAQVELATALATGQLGTDPRIIASSTVRHYRQRVRANRRRLTRR